MNIRPVNEFLAKLADDFWNPKAVILAHIGLHQLNWDFGKGCSKQTCC
jgi:hypothetical protein